jgi:hypothetical protein
MRGKETRRAQTLLLKLHENPRSHVTLLHSTKKYDSSMNNGPKL